VSAQSPPKQPSGTLGENDFWPLAKVRSSRASLTARLVRVFGMARTRQISVVFARVHIQGVANDIPAIIDPECVKQKQGRTGRNQSVEVRQNSVLADERSPVPIRVEGTANDLTPCG
jgi:hypothetical protein